MKNTDRKIVSQKIKELEQKDFRRNPRNARVV